MVKAEWFKCYAEKDRPDSFDRIVHSWDTANKATELSDFSVCTTWGIKGKNLYLLGGCASGSNTWASNARCASSKARSMPMSC
jgi:hypothetical protein